ncbi:MAG: ATP-binding protein [Planctomycetaceae bacterium]
MSFLDKIKKGRQVKPRRTVLYGVHGIGKSTWASMWPNPVFVPTEDGVADIDVASFPLCKDLTDAWTAVMELSSGGHDFKTIVIDSADWLEQLIWQQVCDKREVDSITDIDFGKGYGEASTIFGRFLGALDQCRDNAGMHVVLLSHARATKVEPPGEQSYTRYEPKLHKPSGNGPSASEVLQEWCDELLFCNYRVNVRTEEQGFKRERGIAVGSGERVMFCQEGPSHLAKNRLGLPAEMPLDFRVYQQHLNGTAKVIEAEPSLAS